MGREIEAVQISTDDPETYHVIYNGAIVGFIRLRWGYFGVYYYGRQIYDARIGTKETGSFPNEGLRHHYLGIAKDAIAKRV